MAQRDPDIPFTGEYLDFGDASKDELQTRIFELLTLVETSRELLRARDADDVARRVLLSVIGVLGASSASVLRRDPTQEKMELLVSMGLDFDESLEVALPTPLAESFEQEEEPHPFRVDEELARGPARSFIHGYVDVLERLDAAVVCPLTGRQGLFGFLMLGRRLLSEGYSANDLEVFASLADLYVLALERGAGPAPLLQHETTQVPVEVAATLGKLRQKHPPLREILGESEAILQLFSDMVQLAPSRATVLIQGESGTGKELVARAIHELSPRCEGPMEVVDCSSIPRELIESELFGHVRGAFTGAVRDRRGAFELAHRGTLFLDEIGDMTLASQTRLLRALQEGKFRPVGGEKTRAVDARVIAATNVDLREAVARGEFRKDLFYRIQVFPLRLPPLRERGGDITLLMRTFLKRFYADFGLSEPGVEPGVLEGLEQLRFPGNVRELQNIVESLAIRSRAERTVTVIHLQEVFRSQQIESPVVGQSMPMRGTGTAPPGRGSAPNHGTARDDGTELSPDFGHASDPLPESPGAQVLMAWRDAGFNLLEASRQLKARRSEGEEVHVTDRAQMNHYLDGETLAGILETGNLRDTVDLLAGEGKPRHRVSLRTRRVLQQALEAMEEDELVERFPRLPGEYDRVLAAINTKGLGWLRDRVQL